MVRFTSERLGCNRFSPAMFEFSNIIEELNLLDLTWEGGLFTWSSNTDPPFMSCTDRVLILGDWEEQFPDVTQRLLPRLLSDYSLILMEFGSMAHGKSPFKFENMWLKTEGFVQKVQTWWSSYSFRGTQSFVLSQKLKALKEDLKQWNKMEYGKVGVNKRRLLGEVLKLDEKEGLHGLTQEERRKRWQVKSELDSLIS